MRRLNKKPYTYLEKSKRWNKTYILTILKHQKVTQAAIFTSKTQQDHRKLEFADFERPNVSLQAQLGKIGKPLHQNSAMCARRLTSTGLAGVLFQAGRRP